MESQRVRVYDPARRRFVKPEPEPEEGTAYFVDHREDALRYALNRVPVPKLRPVAGLDLEEGRELTIEQQALLNQAAEAAIDRMMRRALEGS